MQTPTVDDVKDENPVQLDPEQISKCRSHVARCLFLGQDRADNVRCERAVPEMSNPTHHSFATLKRLVRFL